MKSFGKTVSDIGDDELPFPIIFETAFSIGIAALDIGKRNLSARRDFHSLDLNDEIFNLDSISPDILNGTGTHFAGNQ